MGSPSRNVQYHPPRLSEDRLNLPQPHSPSLPTHCTAPGNRECALQPRHEFICRARHGHGEAELLPGGEHSVDGLRHGLQAAAVRVQHVSAGLGTGEQHGADVPLAELAGDLAHVGHPERALDEQPGQQVAVRRIQPPDVRPLDVGRNRQAPVARREPGIGAPQPRRLRVRRTQPLRVAHGADGHQRLLRGLDRREDDAVRTHVEHLLDHPDVLGELAAGRRNPHDDGFARQRVARRGDRGRIQKPLHPRPQRADVVGAVLHIEEDEVDIVVCRERNGVRARVDRDAEGHLVLVEQPDEAGLGHRLRIPLSVHDERGRRHGEDHDECKPRGDGSHGFSLVVPAVPLQRRFSRLRRSGRRSCCPTRAPGPSVPPRIPGSAIAANRQGPTPGTGSASSSQARSRGASWTTRHRQAASVTATVAPVATSVNCAPPSCKRHRVALPSCPSIVRLHHTIDMSPGDQDNRQPE